MSKQVKMAALMYGERWYGENKMSKYCYASAKHRSWMAMYEDFYDETISKTAVEQAENFLFAHLKLIDQLFAYFRRWDKSIEQAYEAWQHRNPGIYWFGQRDTLLGLLFVAKQVECIYSSMQLEMAA